MRTLTPAGRSRRASTSLLGMLRSAGAAVILLLAAMTAAVLVPPSVRGLSFVTGWGVLRTWGVVAVTVALPLVVAIALAWLAARRPRLALAAAFGLFAVVRVAFLVGVDAPVVSDWLGYHRLALGFLAGAPPVADQPMGYPMLLGAAYELGGVSATSAETLNLVASFVTAAATWYLVRLAAGPVAGVVAVGLLAATPTQLLFTAIRGSDTVFTAFLAVAAALASIIAIRLRRAMPDRVAGIAVGLGLLLGVAAWVRPTALAVAPFLALVPLATRRDAGALRAVVAVVAGVLIATAPVVAINAVHTGRFSPTTTLFGGWQLYVGANLETLGRWNREDWDRLNRLAPVEPAVAREYAAGRFGLGPVLAAVERDRIAMALYRERIADVGARFVGILPAKFALGWGVADVAARWVFAEGRRDGMEPPFRLARAWSQAWWTVLLALGAAGLLIAGRRERPLVLASVATFVPITLGLLLLEPQGRYHEYVVPLVAASASIAITAAASRLGRLRKAERKGPCARIPRRDGEVA